MAFYAVAMATLAAATVLVYLGLRRLNRQPTIPKMERLGQKLCALLFMLLPAGLMLAGGMLGGLYLQGSMGLAPAASNDTNIVLMGLGLVVPALLCGYLAMAALYHAAFGKTDYVSPAHAQKAAAFKGGYKGLEKRVYAVFTALFFLSGCVFLLGIIWQPGTLSS